MPAPMRSWFDAIHNTRGARLDAAFHPASRAAAGSGADASRPPGAAGDRTLAVIAHGVTSNKDRPYLVQVAEGLAGAGVPALRFTFAGNPGSGGRFEDCTPSREVDDLGSVIDAAGREGYGRIVCIGHSLGAAVCVLRAARDARIGALVSLAGMVHVAAFMQRHFGGLRPGEPMLGREGCPWSAALAEDAARIGSVLPQAATIAVPWLLVHGTADELVPLSDAHDARAAAGFQPVLVELPGCDHRFTNAGEIVASTVTDWVLGPGRA